MKLKTKLIVIGSLTVVTLIVAGVAYVELFVKGDIHLPFMGQQAATGQVSRTVKSEPDTFTWVGKVTSYTNEESYFPRWSGTKAKITVKHKITSGTLTVGVMDGVADWVLRGKAISSPDEPSITFTTESGKPGVWMIILGFREASGEIEVSISPAP